MKASIVMQLLRKAASRVTATVVREVTLALVLSGAAAFVVWGISGWSLDAAKIAGGLFAAGIGALFLVEAD